MVLYTIIEVIVALVAAILLAVCTQKTDGAVSSYLDQMEDDTMYSQFGQVGGCKVVCSR